MRDDSLNCVIYSISPIHTITSLAAVLSLHENEDIQATVVVHWPGIDEKIVDEITAIVQALSGNFPMVKRMVSITSVEKEAMLISGNCAVAVNLLKQRLGREAFDEFYYPHDIDGGMQQFIATAYPDARRICIGDAMGFVYEKKVHLSFYTVPHNSFFKIMSAARRTKNKTVNIIKLYANAWKLLFVRSATGEQIVFAEFPPHDAALAIPVDQSGNFLRKIPFVVCKREIVLDVMSQCITSCHELQAYVRELCTRYREEEKFLLLTENNAEGKFIEFDREIEMYCSIITANCARGSVVFLKSHPAETLPRNERIQERLGNSYEIVPLDSRFRRYPIELWKEMLFECKIICMSSPILTLKYLYDIDVIQPMNDVFIERWFHRWTWASYKNARTLYMEPLQRLDTWDGKSVLWSGRMNS